MEQLNGLDSLLILSEFENCPFHIGAIMLYERPTADCDAFSENHITALLNDVIDNTLPILKSKADIDRLSLDHPYWVQDKHFNLQAHIHRQTLSRPSDWDSLHQLAAAFHAQPLTSDKPLWEVMVVEGIEAIDGLPYGGVAVLLKIHHALADGKTAMKLFSALHTLSPEADAPLLARGLGDHSPNFSAPNWLGKYSRAYWHTVSSPMKMMRQLTGLSAKMIKERPAKPTAKAKNPPRTAFTATPDADRVMGHIAIPFTEISHITENSVYTINDIAITIIAGAMREFLANTESLFNAELQAMIPIDIRHGNDDNSIGNQLSFSKIKLFSEIDNAALRLEAVHQATNQLKKTHRRMGPSALLDFTNTTYPSILTFAAGKAVKYGLFEKLPPLTNTVISNVPGIPVPCYLNGAKLVDYVGMGFLAPTITLFHVISSVYSHMNISFLSCANSLENADTYQQALQGSYQALLEATKKQS